MTTTSTTGHHGGGTNHDPSRASVALDRSALHGAAWTGVAKWSTQLIAWLATIAVARLLAPHDYGVVAMATIYLGLIGVLSEFGIGTTIVMRDLTPHHVAQFNSLAVLLGVGCFLLSVAVAWPLGQFFHADELPLVVVVLSLTFLLNAFQIVPSGLLRRELQFRRLAMIDIVRGMLVPAGTVTFALLGFRYWALVLGAVLSALISTLLTLLARTAPFARPTFEGLGANARFSRDVVVGRLAYFMYSESDFIVAGRRLGQSALGAYSLAWIIANSPIEKIQALLTDVSPSILSAVQHNRAALRRYFLNMTELLTFVTFPVALGISVVSRDLVLALLGQKWEAVIVLLMLLGGYSTLRSVTPLFGHVLTATNQSHFAMWANVVTAVVLVISFIIGSHWGTVGIAMAWVLVHPILVAVQFRRVQRVLDLSFRDYVRSLRLGLDGSLLMVIAVIAVTRLLPTTLAPAPRLAIEIAVGATVFVTTTLALHGRRLLEIREWFQRIRSGDSAPVGATDAA